MLAVHIWLDLQYMRSKLHVSSKHQIELYGAQYALNCLELWAHWSHSALNTNTIFELNFYSPAKYYRSAFELHFLGIADFYRDLAPTSVPWSWRNSMNFFSERAKY